MQIMQNNQFPINSRTKISKSLQKADKDSQYNRKQNYIGITLHDQTISYEPMQSIKQEQNNENKESQTQTPQFGINYHRQKNRQILKTQLNEQNQLYEGINFKKASYHGDIDHRSFNKINISLADANNIEQNKKQKKRHIKSKRLVTYPSKISANAFNHTSIGAFYCLNEKKDKMLQKMKIDKERVKSLKLNDMMLVTKYASKFNINIKQMMK